MNKDHDGKDSIAGALDGEALRIHIARRRQEFLRYLAECGRKCAAECAQECAAEGDPVGAASLAKEGEILSALAARGLQVAKRAGSLAHWEVVAGGSVSALRKTARRGLNLMYLSWDQVQEVPSRYGSTDQQIEDAAALGAQVIRQFGYCDLLWGHLTGDFTSDAAAGAAVSTDPGGQVGENTQHLDNLASVFAGLNDKGLKVIFTFMTLGGGATEQKYVDAGFSDPLGEYVASSFAGSSMLPLAWSEGHATRSKCDLWGTTHWFPYLLPSYTPEVRNVMFHLHEDWYLGTFDVRSGYKRVVLGEVAEAAVERIKEAARRARLDSNDPSSVVEGIEIFNETDLRNVVMRGDTASLSGADYWARAWAEVAVRFRAGLGDGVKLFGPSLSSYEITDAYPSRGSRRWKMEWYLLFLLCLDGCLPREYPMGELIAGMDYHFYHRAAGRVAHACGLARDVALLRAMFKFVGVEEPQISVFEVGVSADGEDDCPIADSATDLDAWEAFQAHEVWRRFVAALAGGASIAGHHSWMSRTNSQFGGMGLRRDGEVIHRAIDAVPRPAYGAYWATTALAGRVLAARFLLPDIAVTPATGGHFDDLDLTALEAEDFVAAVELELDGGLTPQGFSDYLYVLFIDPSGAARVTEADVRVRVRDRTPPRNATIVDGLPVPGWTSAGNDDLPAATDPSTWARAADQVLAVGTGEQTVHLDIEDGPLLISTQAGTRLLFEVTSTRSLRFRRCRHARSASRRVAGLADLLRSRASGA